MFPERGGTAQLFWGLIVCFITFGAYMMYAPFIADSDDKLSQLAQLQIFLTLLSSLALRASPPSALVASLVSVILILVPLAGVAMETRLFDDLAYFGAILKRAFMRLVPGCTPPVLNVQGDPNSSQSAKQAHSPQPLPGSDTAPTIHKNELNA